VVRSAELSSSASTISVMPRRIRALRAAWLVALCATLAACAQTYPHAIVHAPAAAAVPYAAAPRYAAQPAPPRMIIAAPASEVALAEAAVGPQPPTPDPTPMPAGVPGAPMIAQPRVSRYVAPYYRSQVQVDAPYFHARPYYGYRAYPLYSGGPRFGLGWYGGIARHRYDSGPRQHGHHQPGHGYGRGQRHGRR